MSNDTPKGFTELKDIEGVFISDSEIVILGKPVPDSEGHSCDVMGCSSLSHVIFRANIINAINGVGDTK